ncbi:MAG: nuclear transport factor 2 family protein [Ignavibacteriota bacterium]
MPDKGHERSENFWRRGRDADNCRAQPAATAAVYTGDGHPQSSTGRRRLEFRDPRTGSLAYTVDSRWRNRSEFVTGRAEIVAFLTRKWAKEKEYRLIKELWAHDGNRIAACFAYEWQDDSGKWFRAYGNENWEFDENGLMRVRHASINDLAIDESARKYHWPLGKRPDGHPGLSDLGL